VPVFVILGCEDEASSDIPKHDQAQLGERMKRLISHVR